MGARNAWQAFTVLVNAYLLPVGLARTNTRDWSAVVLSLSIEMPPACWDNDAAGVVSPGNLTHCWSTRLASALKLT